MYIGCNIRLIKIKQKYKEKKTPIEERMKHYVFVESLIAYIDTCECIIMF